MVVFGHPFDFSVTSRMIIEIDSRHNSACSFKKRRVS